MSHNGFYRRRRGVLEHLESGSITLFDSAVHDFVCLNAQSRVGIGSQIGPGVWIGSAKKIWLLTGRQDCERKIQRSLEKLEQLGWVKRFSNPGRRGDYPLLVARWIVSDGAGNDFIVNAEKTTDWRKPVIEPCPRRGNDLSLDRRPAVSEPSRLLQEVETKREEDDNTRREPSVLALAKEYAFQHFFQTKGEKPSWGKGDYGQLAALFQRKNDLTLEEFCKRWQNYSESTDPFIANQGLSLKFFSTNFDRFLGRPIHQTGGHARTENPVKEILPDGKGKFGSIPRL